MERMSSPLPEPAAARRHHAEAVAERGEERALLALVDRADAQQALGGGRLLADRDAVVAGRGDDDDPGGQRPADRRVDLVAAHRPDDRDVGAEREVDHVRAVRARPVDPGRDVLAVPLPSSSSTRTGMSFAPGATEEMPTPLPVAASGDPADVRAVAVAVLGRRVVCDEVAPRQEPAGQVGMVELRRRSPPPRSPRPRPVAVACAASDSIRSRFHCSPRRGSACARRDGGERGRAPRGRGTMHRITERTACPLSSAPPTRRYTVRDNVQTVWRPRSSPSRSRSARGSATLREAMDLSLRDLAERSGVSAPMLSQVERGETSPTLQVAARIAAGLELRLSQLLRLDEEGIVTDRAPRRAPPRRRRRPRLRDPHPAAARPARRGLPPHARPRRRPPAAPATRRCTSPAPRETAVVEPAP